MVASSVCTEAVLRNGCCPSPAIYLTLYLSCTQTHTHRTPYYFLPSAASSSLASLTIMEPGEVGSV